MAEVQSAYRRFARRPVLWIGGVLLLLFVIEMQLDLVERAIGQYLQWHNPKREKIGRSWQIDQSRIAASSRLETLTRDSRERMGLVERISTFGELVEYTESSSRTALPLAQFSRIYRQLPELFQPLIVSLNDLLLYQQEQEINNMVINRYADRMDFFFLDRNNQIVHQSTLSANQVRMILRHGTKQPVSVQTDARYAQHAMDISTFYARLDRVFYDDRENIIKSLPALTDLDKNIQHVAFGREIIDGFVETALALDDNRAIIYYLPEEWTIELTSRQRRHEGWNNF